MAEAPKNEVTPKRLQKVSAGELNARENLEKNYCVMAEWKFTYFTLICNPIPKKKRNAMKIES